MSAAEETNKAGLEQVLEYLQRTRGFDFSAYKRPSLERRVLKRLQAVNIESYADYIDYLEVHPDEFEALFNTVLINVTEFFRDEPAWEVIRETVVPRLLAAKRPSEPIRVWSAGCAAGQEPYSIAMVLADLMDEESFRQRVKIYATDVDEEALSEARAATYTESQVQGVPAGMREKYFELVNHHYNFRKDLRRGVIFGRHDLLQDSPISRVDLLICRNTLMYFNAEAQSRVLSHFDFALTNLGYLFLGKAEVLLTRSAAFVPIDIKHRIFAKAARPTPGERIMPPMELDGGLEANGTQERLRELALETDPVAQAVLDLSGNLIVVNALARQLFNVHPAEMGERLVESQLLRPTDLRFAIEQALNERRVVQIKEVEWAPVTGEKRYLDVSVYPLLDTGSRPLGVKLLFNDVTRFRRLQDELNRSHQELETANEELQSSNEELETTNEELQSTVEELETTNEELQSTNEELETMNEELQSTNEEMENVNGELRRRGQDLDQVNAFLESIVAGLRDGVAVLDSNLMVRTWNDRAEDLWGLRSEEVHGQHFLGLDIGLPMDQIKPLLRTVLGGEPNSGAERVDVPAINRRGKNITVRVSANRLTDPAESRHGVILMMEELHAADGTEGG
jgi:two-component system CheB/CheR fusion protein